MPSLPLNTKRTSRCSAKQLSTGRTATQKVRLTCLRSLFLTDENTLLCRATQVPRLRFENPALKRHGSYWIRCSRRTEPSQLGLESRHRAAFQLVLFLVIWFVNLIRRSSHRSCQRRSKLKLVKYNRSWFIDENRLHLYARNFLFWIVFVLYFTQLHKYFCFFSRSKGNKDFNNFKSVRQLNMYEFAVVTISAWQSSR